MTEQRLAIVYSGGVGHPFDETSPALARLAGEAGWDAHVHTDLDAVLARLGETDLLVVNALYWSMAQDEKYLPLRERWAFLLADSQMAAITEFVVCGGRLLVIHTGTICWDSQPRWQQIMGGGWQWGVSRHPPLGMFDVALTEAGRAISSGATKFTLIDEAYHDLRPSQDCTILATADLGEGRQPLAWIRRVGKARVAVDALGHDVRSLSEPGHRALIEGQLRWLASDA